MTISWPFQTLLPNATGPCNTMAGIHDYDEYLLYFTQWYPRRNSAKPHEIHMLIADTMMFVTQWEISPMNYIETCDERLP